MLPLSRAMKFLPFYEKHGLNIEAILTDHGKEYCGWLTHRHDEIYLGLKRH